MTNNLLNNESLKTFIEKVGLDEEKKGFLLSKVDTMNEEERKDLFNLLTKIYVLDIEEEEAKKRISEFWQ